MQKVFSSRSRLEKIANDIIFDFETKVRLMDGNGNAMLVAHSVYEACKYFEIFQSKGFHKCAIISSYVPSPGDLRTDTVSEDEDTETFEKYAIYLKMVGIDEGEDSKNTSGKVEAFEKRVKKQFVEEPANKKLLIVVDKLLTGFDAPPCTYLSSGFFTALNDGLTSAIISFVRTLILESAAVLLLPRIFGIDGIWYSTVVSELLAFFLGVVFLIAKRKKYHY